MQKLSALALGTLLAALVGAGCFSSNPDLPTERDLGDPVASTLISATDWVEGMTVEPGTGALLVGTTNWNGNYEIRRIERGTGTILESTETIAWGWNLVATGPGEVVISDGSYTHTLVDLADGTTTSLSGLEALAERTPAFMGAASASDMGGAAEIVAIECEPNPGSPIEVFAENGDDFVNVDSIPLQGDPGSVYSVAFAPDLGVVFAMTDQGLRGYERSSGELDLIFNDDGGRYLTSIAYDTTTGRLLGIGYDAAGRTTIYEYEL